MMENKEGRVGEGAESSIIEGNLAAAEGTMASFILPVFAVS